ncbi:uncharacterized protein LOC106081556 [Stomoxys calcitrans]|uniref:uncharacterized protein LOC106081556 n=1 Tax=Stomoxys calcitrans TaxID=35570 RepID=UPI0027E23662|nr:uncharacterized protein LOC106081556 [Stomoxys calcitrans]
MDEKESELSQTREIEILMVGLDNAGKTELLYTLKNGHVVATIPTIGYNVETIEHKDVKYTIYDIGGLRSVRVLRNFYVENKQAVIYVVDVSAGERFEEAKKDLHDLVEKNSSHLSNAVLLILANKIDLVPQFDVHSLAERLGLNALSQKWQIHASSAVKDGEKLFEIFDILNKMIEDNNNK